MTSAAGFLDALADAGIRFVSGVPCSYFSGPLRLIRDHPDLTYTAAANEGNALALAVGAHLAGARSAVLIQNSGFGNIVNPLTSLVLPYRIPVLVVMSMRGWPHAAAGEPQHKLMGQVIPSWLRELDVPFWTFIDGGTPLPELLAQAGQDMASDRPAFLLVGKGAIATRLPPPATASAGITGAALAAELLTHLPDGEPVLSTTGYLSRALYQAGHRDAHFYMQGSMGHVAGTALGVALQDPRRRVVVLDGDGAALMHLGTFAVIGGNRPPNLVHVVFDNGGYESTGGQPAPAAVDFAGVARACGYLTTITVTEETALSRGIKNALAAPGPVLLTVHGVAGDTGPGARASEDLPVRTIATTFQAVLTGSVLDGDRTGRSQR